MTVDQGAFFAKSELEFVNLSAIPPAPEGYELPTCFPRIHEAKRVSVDLETHDPDLRSKGPGVRRDGYIVGVGVAIDDGPDTPVSFADYYPIRHMNGPNLDPAHVMQWLKDELNTFRGEIVGANVCLYDGDYLQEYGVRPERAKWRDVQWAEALIDEEAPDYKLNTLAKKYLGLTKVTDELTEKYGPEYITNFEKVHPGHAKSYVMGDIHLPLGILNKQHEALRSEGMVKLFDLECRLTPFLLYLRQKGVRVDLQKALKFNDVLAEKRDEQLQILSSLAGFKITADTFEKKDVLVRALDACGVKYPRTEKGAPSIVRQWLDHLEHPFGKVLNAVRKYDKARGTFVESYILENHINGRIHGEFHPLRRADEDGNRGTVSGRFSGTHPNLQNIPSRDEEIGPLCRSMFIPEEGFNWWSLDYCVAPETRVLTADLRWIKASSVVIGQELLGVDELLPSPEGKQFGRRKLRLATVEGVKRITQPRYKIVTDKGTVVSSALHKWLYKPSPLPNKRASWRETRLLKPGNAITMACLPWNEDTSLDAAYMAGLLDGEGYISRGCIAFAQKPGVVLDKGVQILRAKGFDVKIDSHKSGVFRVRVNGGRSEFFRLLGTLRSQRLLNNAKKLWPNETVQSTHVCPATILSVEYLGEGEVIALQTSSRTFIAEGFVSHNSQIEYRFLVHYAVAAYKSCKDPERKEKLRTALDARQRYIDDPGMDFHQGVADMTGLRRKAAKNLNFGLVYGMGKNKLAASLGLVGPDGQPLPEAIAIMDAYHGKAPFIRELYQMASERAQSQGYIKTILNRRSRFNLWEPKYTERGAARPMAYTLEDAESVYGKRIKRAHTHKALNRILQGSAADLMKLAMVTIWESGLISEPFAAHLTVHDELDGSVEPSERGKKAHDEAKHIMETCMTLELPILTGGETGANWAEAH